jgi:hypothetical protein
MAIADDISVAANGDIRWTGSTANYTVLEFYRFLQGLAYNSTSSGDDLLDITNTNPATASTTEIITLNAPYNINDALAQHIYGGSVTQDGGDVLYSGLQVIGSVNSASTQLQIVQNNTLLTNYWSTGINTAGGYLLRLMIKTRTGGADIDGKRVRVQARELGDTYAEFTATLGTGESVAAISTNQDLNNQTGAAGIAAWTSITNVEGFQTIDLDNGNGAREYYSQWNKGSQSLNDLYERTKWIQRRGTSETIHGINGELFRGITHSWAYDGDFSPAVGPFQEDEIVSWSTGTALLLALDTDKMYVQLLTGTAPVNDTAISGNTSSASAAVNGAPTARTVSPSFIGASTGTNIIGAYGIGIEPTDVTASDSLFDLTNTQQVPPNFQTFSVTNLVSSEDTVLVGPNDGSDELDLDQLSAAAGNNAGNGTLVISGAIPSDTPSSGTVRAFNGSSYDRIPYSSFSGSTFTLSGTLPNNIATSANVFVTYVDKTAAATSESYTAKYSTDRSLVVKVRNGTGTIPIVPFKTPATFGAGGGSVSVIRTADV